MIVFIFFENIFNIVQYKFREFICRHRESYEKEAILSKL